MENTLKKLRNKQPVTIVVQGDSNTLVSMNTQGRMNWVGYLTEALWERYGDGLVTMINVSRCGFSFKNLPDMLDHQILRWRPDLVIFQIWLCGSEDRRAGRLESAKEVFRQSVARIRESGQGQTDVLVCTPNPRVLCYGHAMPEGAKPGEVYESPDWNTELCAELVELARSCGCSVVDHFSIWKRKRYKFAHPGANPRGLWQRMIDSVHPNATGHLALFRALAPMFDVAPYFAWEEVATDSDAP